MNSTPEIGAIAQWNSGAHGHVAYVIDYNSITKIVKVAQYNAASTGVYTEQEFDTSQTGNGKPENYIHIQRGPLLHAPGGWWLDSTPRDGTATLLDGLGLQVAVHGTDNSGSGLRQIDITWQMGGSAQWSKNTKPIFSSTTTQSDHSYLIPAPVGGWPSEVVISFDVYSNDGKIREAPQGMRRICRSGLACAPITVPGEQGGGPSTGCVPGQYQVSLFVDENYQGACVTKGIGTYNTPEEIGLPNDSISSVKVGSGANAYLCVHAGINTPCDGKNQDVPNMSNTTVGTNSVSSLRVEGGQPTTDCAPGASEVAFFMNENYTGTCIIKGIGRYDDPAALGLTNDSISSLKVGDRVKVRACNNAGNNSPCEEFDYNDPDLSNNSLGTNVISSADVYSRGDVELCEHPNYGGTCKTFGIGVVNDLSQYGLSNNVSSIRILAGAYTVFLNDGVNQSGQPGIFDHNMPDLGGQYGWNDRARSVKIEKQNDTACTIDPNANGILLYRDGGFQPGGGCKLITGDISDLRPSTFDGFTGLRFMGTYKYHYRISVYKDANYGTFCGSYWLDQSWMAGPDCTRAQGGVVSLKVEPYTPPAQAHNIVSSALRDSPDTQATVDDNLDTQWIGGHKKPLGFVFENSQTIKSVVVFDRTQSSTDNNQINKSKLVFSDGTIVTDIDMGSGGPRCAEVNIPAKAVSWVNVVPDDASGNNGFREIQIWDTSGDVYSNLNCINKYSRTPVPGTGPAPTVSWPTPPPPPAPTGYQAQYFNNRDLSGTPALTRTEAVIDNTWNDGGPGSPIGVDNFSARWTKTADFAAGSYTFTATGDDGLRLYIDDQLVIDRWIDQGSTTYEATKTLSAGNHTIKYEYYESGGGAVAKLNYAAVTPEVYQAQYYNNRDFTGSPVATRTEEEAIDFDWGDSGKPDPSLDANNFAARWTKTTNLEAGYYTFMATADDGVRLYIDGERVIDKWFGQSPTSYTTGRTLAAGSHTIVMEYYESGGGAVAGLRYAKHSQSDYLAEYYTNREFKNVPRLIRSEATIDHDWGGGSPDTAVPINDFAARWTKTVDLPAGTYRFTTTGDDGLRLFVDNQLVIDKWIDQGATTYTADRTLDAGTHTLRFEYYEGGGGAVAKMSYAQVANPPPAQGTELLTALWHLTGNNGASETYQSIDPNILAGKTTMRITYDLHGLQALGNDASAIIFDQNGWKYVSLSGYGQNGLNGSQTVDIPLSTFGLNLSQAVGTLHTRFWHSALFTVDITSIRVF